MILLESNFELKSGYSKGRLTATHLLMFHRVYLSPVIYYFTNTYQCSIFQFLNASAAPLHPSTPEYPGFFSEFGRAAHRVSKLLEFKPLIKVP